MKMEGTASGKVDGESVSSRSGSGGGGRRLPSGICDLILFANVLRISACISHLHCRFLFFFVCVGNRPSQGVIVTNSEQSVTLDPTVYYSLESFVATHDMTCIDLV